MGRIGYRLLKTIYNHLTDPGKMVNPQTMKSTLLNNTNCPAIPVGAELTYLRPAFDGDWYGYKGKEYIILKQHIEHGSIARHLPERRNIGNVA